MASLGAGLWGYRWEKERGILTFSLYMSILLIAFIFSEGLFTLDSFAPPDINLDPTVQHTRAKNKFHFWKPINNFYLKI